MVTRTTAQPDMATHVLDAQGYGKKWSCRRHFSTSDGMAPRTNGRGMAGVCAGRMGYVWLGLGLLTLALMAHAGAFFVLRALLGGWRSVFLPTDPLFARLCSWGCYCHSTGLPQYCW